MDKIIDKIKKLLALSQSSNVHEAANAAAMAAELMIKHELQAADLASERGEVVQAITDQVIDSDGKCVEWKRQLSAGVARASGCRPYHSTGGGSAEYHIIGTEAAINTCRYLYAMLVSETNRLATLGFKAEMTEWIDTYKDRLNSLEARHSKPSVRSWKGSFRVGCARAIATRLREQRSTTIAKARTDQNSSSALVIVDKQAEALNTFVRQNYRFSQGARSSAGSNSSGYAAGKTAGNGVNLGRNTALGKGQARLK